MLIDRDLATSQSAFARYSALLRKCVHAAWDDWNDSGLAPVLQTKSFRAQYVNHQIVVRAKEFTEGRTDVRVDRIHGIYGFVIDNRIFVRPKYARTGYKSSNYPTRAALAFHDQSLDLFGGIARLELIYTINKLGTQIQDICLTQRNKERIEWMLPLLDAAQDNQENLVKLVVQDPLGTAADRIIKSKRSNGIDQGDQYKRGGGGV
jgi:hypothetical protein